MEELKNYNIYAGLGGSFGGAYYKGTLKNVTEDKAFEYAYNIACDDFESYAGYNGLAEYSDFVEDFPEGTQEEYDEWYSQQREDWVDCYVVDEKEDNIDEDEYFELE